MRRFVLAALAISLVGGCAYSMIEKGQFRVADLRRMLARTAATRGLPLPGKLDTRVMPRADLPQLLRQMLRDDWTDAELRDAQEVMTAIGLWPDGVDLLEETVTVQGDEIAGLYSPERRTLYIVEGVEVPAIVDTTSALTGRDLYAEFVLSHEIVHALQHNAFADLFDATAHWKEHDDVVLALHAALEGDAIRYGLETVSPDGPLPEPRQFVEMQEQHVEEGALAEAPALLRYALFFPYVYGYPLALSEGKRLLREPPVSTEQAMHDDKRREPFTFIDLSAAALPIGCRLVGTNTMGELLISILLRSHGEGIEAGVWEGWDGDRYLVAHCDGRRAFAWIVIWDSEADATEFEAAYGAVAGAVRDAAGLVAVPRIERNGAEVRVFTEELTTTARGFDLRSHHFRVATLADLQARVAKTGD